MKPKGSSARRGLLAGGNWIIDQVKLIDVYPQREQLGNILSPAQPGTGGAPFNVLVDLARLGADFPLLAAGLVGRDPLGDQILAICRQHQLDTRRGLVVALSWTSATPVRTRPGSSPR